MIISALLLIYNLIIAFVAGLAANKLLSKAIGITNPIIHPTLVVLSGWFFMGIALQIFHLFHRIDFTAHLFIWSLLSLVFAAHAKSLVKDAIASLHQIATKQHLVVALSLFVAVLVNIIQRKADGDIGDYHLQAIRWAEEYAVVPGIGNIRRQLGNNSNWFLLNAFSGFGFLKLRSVYTINAGLVILVGIYVAPHLKQHYWLRNLVLLGYFSVVATRKYTGAVTNDLIITSGIVLLFCWFTDLMNEPTKPTHSLVLILLLSLGLTTFKLSALPMSILSLGMGVFIIKQKLITKRLITTVASLVGLMFIPWFITNVIQTGYLLFPATSTNWFGVDWQMRPEIVNFEVYANLAYARAPTVDIEIARYFTFKQWFPYWLKSLDVFSIILLVGGTFFLLALLVQLIINKKFRAYFHSHHYVFIAATILIALVLWFTHGPTPRFVFGYLIFSLAMGINLINRQTIQQFISKYLLALSFIITVSIAIVQLNAWRKTNIKTTLLLPPNYHQSLLNTYPVDGGYLWVPSANEQCWDAILPCTNLPDSSLQYRGTSLKYGFRIKR